jgi:hypothetical protein
MYIYVYNINRSSLLLLDVFSLFGEIQNEFYYYNEKVDGIDSNDSCDNNKYITT